MPNENTMNHEGLPFSRIRTKVIKCYIIMTGKITTAGVIIVSFFLITPSLTSGRTERWNNPAIYSVPTADNSARVMSFNIRYNTAQDGDRAWPYRKGRVAAHIRAYQPDVIGVQEALKGQIDDMEQLLPGYGWVGVGRIDGKEGGEFTPIFYRKDRFELLDHSTFWLSETPGTCGTKGWDASCQRTTTWCKLRDRNSGQTLFHFNTHFDHRGSRARRESANLLLEKIKEISGNAAVVTTGDFNCGESSKTYRILTDREDPKSLQDAYYKSIPHNYGPQQTWRGFQWFGIVPKKIDFIFVKNRVRVIRHCIPDEPLYNGFISDHNPVFADILPG